MVRVAIQEPRTAARCIGGAPNAIATSDPRAQGQAAMLYYMLSLANGTLGGGVHPGCGCVLKETWPMAPSPVREAAPLAWAAAWLQRPIGACLRNCKPSPRRDCLSTAEQPPRSCPCGAVWLAGSAGPQARKKATSDCHTQRQSKWQYFTKFI